MSPTIWNQYYESVLLINHFPDHGCRVCRVPLHNHTAENRPTFESSEAKQEETPACRPIHLGSLFEKFQ